MTELRAGAYALRMWLESNFGVLAPWQALAGAVFLAVYLSRKYAPELWALAESLGPQGATASRVFLALPSVLLATAVGAISSAQDPWVAVQGAAVGALMPLVHHALKAYRGRADSSAMPPRKSLYSGAAMLVLSK